MELTDMFKRLLYLAYYFKELDRNKLKNFLKFVSKRAGKSKIFLLTDAIKSSLKYNISILEYFQFHFYRLDAEERNSFAGTGYMYEYQLVMNPRDARPVLSDKLKFLEEYRKFVRHQHAPLRDIEEEPAIGEKILANPSGKVVLKKSDGQCGIGIEVRRSSDFSVPTLIRRLKETGNDFVESFVIQHDELMRLSPAGLNTVRIITQLDASDQVHILGARLRITVNSSVDNLAAGNIAAPVNVSSGIVEGPGVYSDITRQDEDLHPITRVLIKGFAVPYWQETVAMTKRAALLNKSNRSIGWDIAITNEGPELIEGNHDWCKLLWQLPVKKGLKPLLESYRVQNRA
jgi:hypothetical protein